MSVKLTRPQAAEIGRIRTQGDKGIPLCEANTSTRALERAGYVIVRQMPGSEARRYVLTEKGAHFANVR